MDPDELPARIAGLRTVRVVGAGSRARMVLLQHPDGVLARLWHASVSRTEVDRELAAMSRIHDPHVLRPSDVETLEGGRVAAIVPRLGRGSVLRLLERRGELAYGEAVTLIAPIASAVDALHRAGVCHGRIGAGRVLLDDAGAPVLVGFGSASLFDRGLSPSARESATASDLAALRSYCDRILTHVADPRSAVARARIETEHAELGRAVCDALFSEGAGSPIRFPDADARAPVLVAGRVGSVPVDPRASGARGGPSASRMADILDRGTSGVRSGIERRWSALPRARRLMVIGAGAAVATAVSAAVMVPGEASSSGPSPTPSPTPTVSRGTRTATHPPTPSPSRDAATVPSATPDPDAVDPAAVVRASDPLAATAILIRARERCLRESDARCLASVDEPGSIAEQDDREAIAGRREPLLPSVDLSLVDMLGAAAVLTTPAQRILAIRTDLGWRIREISRAEDAPVPG